MPDKWEYPWYAAWDLAFHMLPYARIDPAFAKEQLVLAEAAQTVQDVVVINRGHLAAEGPVAELAAADGAGTLEDLFFDLTSDHQDNRAQEVHPS